VLVAVVLAWLAAVPSEPGARVSAPDATSETTASSPKNPATATASAPAPASTTTLTLSAGTPTTTPVS